MGSNRHAVRWWSALVAATVGAGVLGGASAQAVSGGTPVPAGTYPFAAKIQNDLRACSGALVDPFWVLTASSCFAENGQPVVAGVPARATTVTVGRTNLTSTGGHVLAVTSLVPHPSRHVVLARLARPATGVNPVALGAAPSTGEELVAAGYGRTATEWVPDNLHASSFTVQGVTADDVEIDGAPGGGTLCRGDAGGPALRTVGTTVELVAVHDRSWQGGCLGETETRRTATGIRVDDLGDWIQASLKRSLPLITGHSGDYNGDGYTDLALYRPSSGQWHIKNLRTGTQIAASYPYGGGGDIPAPGDYDGDGWTDLALYRRDCVNGSTWWVKSLRTGQQIYAGHRYGGCADIPAPGDYDGDGHTDLGLYRQDCVNGSSWSVLSRRTGQHIYSGFKYGGCRDDPAPGDYDGDKHTDLALYRQDCVNGSSWSVLSRRTGQHIYSGHRYGGCADLVAPGDYDADGHADLALFRPSNGSWSIKSVRTGGQIVSGHVYGGGDDIPAPGDYNGDGRHDLSLFRPTVGWWNVKNISTGQQITASHPYGGWNDIPATG